MKSLLIALCMFVLVGGVSADEHVGRFACKDTVMRQNSGAKIASNAALYFQVYQTEEGRFLLKNVLGHVMVGYVWDGTIDSRYYGIFSFDQLADNPAYKPQKYVGAAQYKDFNAVKTNGNDGGGMNGTLVLDKKFDQKKFHAHYIFQAGEHMGGTLDFECFAD